MCDVPEDQEEFDEAWARIVEDLTGTDPELGMDPGTEPATGTAGTAPPEAEATAGASRSRPGPRGPLRAAAPT